MPRPVSLYRGVIDTTTRSVTGTSPTVISNMLATNSATSGSVAVTMSVDGQTLLRMDAGSAATPPSVTSAAELAGRHVLLTDHWTLMLAANASGVSLHVNGVDLAAPTPVDIRPTTFYRQVLNTGSATTYQDLYTVPDGFTAVITSMAVFNTGTAGPVTLAIDGIAAWQQPNATTTGTLDSTVHVLNSGSVLTAASAVNATVHVTGVLFPSVA